MKSEAKKILLERKFSSIEYMRLYVELYKQFVDSIERGMNTFFEFQKQNPAVDGSNIDAWESKGLPNLKGSLFRAEQALQRAEQGDIQGISCSAGNLKGLSRDVDHIGGFGGWWKEIDSKYEEDFRLAFNLSHFAACNIYYTERGFWEGDEILDERATGPIDEQELLNYLKPEESLEGLA